MTNIQFLGATETVTGSRHLIEVDGYRVLVDCGLFQGLRELRRRNWDPFPVDPGSIHAVILTHAHIDHTGYLPRLVRDGFSGPVYATPASIELSRILLPDSARLQEEEAAYAGRAGYSRYETPLPLYTEANANAALRLLQPVNYDKRLSLTKKISFQFIGSGHILGSGFVSLNIDDGHGSEKQVLLTGDIGRYDEPILNDPEPVAEADYIVLESTYGNRAHPDYDVKERLAEIVNATYTRGGHLLVPAFAVGRTQQLIYLLRELEDEGRVPKIPVFVDSPMAVKATKLYLRHKEDHDLDMQALVKDHRNPLATNLFRLAKTRQESKGVSSLTEPSIVISASGMATGGRILHHLHKRLPDERNTVMFVGFQAVGTRGRRLVDGEKEIKMFGEYVPVRAKIETLENLSAHGDWREILRWLRGFKRPPIRVFLVHGEPEAAAALKDRIQETYGWQVEIPTYLQKSEI